MKCYYPDVFAAALLEQPADGLLRAGADRARRARARRRGAPGRREPFRLGLHAGERPSVARCYADAPCLDERPHPHHACDAARLPPDQRHLRRPRAEDRKRARARLRLGARSVAAHAAAAVRAGAARQCGRVRLARPLAPRCPVGGARACSAPATRTTCRCSAASPCRSWSRTSICRRCRRASRWSRTIATCICR